MTPRPPTSTLFPYTTLFRSVRAVEIDIPLVRPRLAGDHIHHGGLAGAVRADDRAHLARLNRQREIVERLKAVERDRNGIKIDRKSTRLNSSHQIISYAVFCL